MKLYNYEDLIRVIGNVEKREENERLDALFSLKEKYYNLEKNLVQSGIIEDWIRLKDLCQKAKVRLCVSHIGNNSIGYVLGVGDFRYANIYDDSGKIRKYVSRNNTCNDYYTFKYDIYSHSLSWEIVSDSFYGCFDKFRNEEEEYNLRISIIEEFKNTYENYRKFQLMKIEEKFGGRITVEDIVEN